MNNSREAKERLLIISAYLGEVLAATLLYILLRCILPESEIVAFIKKTSVQWATVFGLAVAVPVALWCVFLQLLTTDFGEELRSRKAASIFSSALAFPIFVFLCAAILFLLVPVIDRRLLTHAAAVIGIYATINFVTLIRNVNRFVQIYQEFGGNKTQSGQ